MARLAAQMETPTSTVDHMEISTVASVESGVVRTEENVYSCLWCAYIENLGF